MGATATSRSPFENKVVRVSANDFKRGDTRVPEQSFRREDELASRTFAPKFDRPFSASPFSSLDRWQPSLTHYRE